MDQDPEPSLIEKLENLEGRARQDFFNGDFCLPTRRTDRTIHSSARLVAFDVINAATTGIAERKLFALIDAAASLLIHGGGEESARLCLEVVTTPAVAGSVVRALTDHGA
jgi:hypothetical protein